MRILIVDDERPAREELCNVIHGFMPEAKLTSAASGAEAVELLSGGEAFDAAFFDIELGDISGMSLAAVAGRLLPEMRIAFATAYDRYAVEAFELGATDYILKPFSEERIRATLSRMKPSGNCDNGSLRQDRLTVSNGRTVSVVDIPSITYIETVNRGCLIHLAGGEALQGQSTLSSYEARLLGHSFFKTHKSYLVNLNYLREVGVWDGRNHFITLKETDGEQLPIGRFALRALRSIYDF